MLVEALPSRYRGRAEALVTPIGADDQLEPQGRQHHLADFGRRTSSGLGITLKVASGGLATSSGSESSPLAADRLGGTERRQPRCAPDPAGCDVDEERGRYRAGRVGGIGVPG